ncbi:MAG: aspartate/glutamate racemase family protein [Pseudomonadota bacterium]
MPGIHVINPNASDRVTDAIRAALGGADAVTCHTSHAGPPAIESHADFEASIPPLIGMARGLDADVLVVACFSDPGVDALRAALACPVIGIQEAAVEEAIAAKRRFGIVAIVAASVERQARALRARGQLALWAGSRPLDLGVAALADRARTEARMAEVARALRDEDGAETLILGCAGMPFYRDWLEEDVGLPVIEPCQAALRRAQALIAA